MKKKPEEKVEMEFTNEDLPAFIEALLFIYGEAMDFKKIAQIVSETKKFGKIGSDEVKAIILKLDSDLRLAKGGVRIVLSGKEAQLATRPEFGPLLQDFIKEEFKESLTPASLEVLALILYLGPLTRVQMEYYRGVNCSFILRSLLVRGLVNRNPLQNRPNVYSYEASFDLLRYLGVSKIEDLPDYQKFKELSEKFQSNESK